MSGGGTRAVGLRAISVLVGLAAILVAGGDSVAAGGRMTLSPWSQHAALSARVSATGNPWDAYETSVDPGGAVQLASRLVGFSLSWEPTSGLDQNLSAPAGLVLAWPSPSVLVTRDGARRWTRSLSVRGGFWGIDVLDVDDVWAVAVTGLYRTVDGGRAGSA
jgi:hypothetical protein